MARASTTRGHGKAGLVKGWSCTSCVLIPISLRYFPPLAKGGQGGWSRHDQSQGLSHALSLSVLSHPSREARRIVLDFQGYRITPPDPPFARGGKGSLARDVIPSRATKTRVSIPRWAVTASASSIRDRRRAS